MGNLSEALEAFEANKEECIKKWKASRDQNLEQFDLQADDPFLVSHVEEQLYQEELDRNGSANTLRIQNWIEARIVECYLANRYTGSKLREAVKDGLRVQFPQYYRPRRGTATVFSRFPAALRLRAERARDITKSAGRRLLGDFRLLMSIPLAIANSPPVMSIRWAISKVIGFLWSWLVLFGTLFLIWLNVREQFCEQLAQVPLVGFKCRELPFMSTSPLLTDSSALPFTMSNITNHTNPVPAVVDAYYKMQEASGTLYIIEEILDVVMVDVRESGSIAEVSLIPYSSELVDKYSQLSDIISTRLSDSLFDYRLQVNSAVYGIKGAMELALNELKRFTIDPHAAAVSSLTPLPAYVIPAEAALEVASGLCAVHPFFMHSNLKTWVLCLIVFASNTFLGNEVACWSSTVSQVVPEPNHCLWMLAKSPKDTSVLINRKYAFKISLLSYEAFLKSLSGNLKKIEQALVSPQAQLKELYHLSSNISTLWHKSDSEVSFQSDTMDEAFQQKMNNWTSRNSVTKLRDWWNMIPPPNQDPYKMAIRNCTYSFSQLCCVICFRCCLY